MDGKGEEQVVEKGGSRPEKGAVVVVVAPLIFGIPARLQSTFQRPFGLEPALKLASVQVNSAGQ